MILLSDESMASACGLDVKDATRTLRTGTPTLP